MDVARCTLDNEIYSSVQFSQLGFAEISQKRRHLVCLECRGPAFFRKQTRNGRAACFGARPHQPNCRLATVDETRVIDGYGDMVDIINNPGERIVIDLAFGTQLHVHAEPNEGLANGIARAGAHAAGHNPNNARMHRRLSSLLRTLIESPNFGSSQQILEILEYEVSVRDFFVPLLDIKHYHLNSLKGFWGMLSDVGAGKGAVWLNSGGRDDISFCMDEQSFAAVLNRFHITDTEELSGAYVLAVGEAKMSQNGKLYCAIDNQNMVSLRLT